MERLRKLALCTLAFSGAVFLSQYLLPGPWQLTAAAIAAGCGLAALCLRGRKRLAALLLAFGLAAGFGWNWLYTQTFFAPALALDGQELTFDAVARDFPEETDYGERMEIRILLQDAPDVKATAYFYGECPAGLRPGDRMTLTAKLARADRLYDEETSAYTAKGVFLTAKSARLVASAPRASMPAAYLHRYAAKAIKDKVAAIFPPDTAGFMRALLTGDKILLDEGDAAAMKRAGVYHIVAVSGLHVSVLTGFIFLVFGKRKASALAVFPALLLFMGISGFTPSVVRAVIMQLFMVTAPLIGREDDPVTSLAAALFLLLAADPFAAKSVGLQLSFAAMLGIILVTPAVYRFFDDHISRGFRRRGAGRALFSAVFGGLATSVGALVFTTPLIALYFGYISLAAPVSNLVLLWAVSTAFCVGAAAVAAGFIWLPAGGALAWAASLAVRFVRHTAAAISASAVATVYLDELPVVLWFICVYAGAVLCAVIRPRRSTIVALVGGALIALCVLLVANAETSRMDGSMAVTVVDVGQGQSVVLTCGDYTAVVDCGSSSGERAGERTFDCIAGMGRTAVDLFVLTHYHADHANGAIALMGYADVAALAVPLPQNEESELDEAIIEVAERRGIEVIYVTEDMDLALGGMTVTLFAPMGDLTENERCVTVLASEGDFDFMTTADMGADMERLLVSHARLPRVECLMAGHHGSRTSTSWELLAATRPETVVVSCGYNTYGHPAPETLERIRLFGADVYRTDERGTITIRQGT